MKKTSLILFLFCWFGSALAQPKTHAWEQIDSLQNIQIRKIVVFIHTDWCQVCQAMKSQTFQNKHVIQQLNNTFYFIDFNAEEKRTIGFNKQQFAFKPSGTTSGVHELAVQLGTINDQLNYPVLCLLNEQYEIIFQYAGFLNAKDFKLLLEKIDN